jgi:hypothetical protein
MKIKNWLVFGLVIASIGGVFNVMSNAKKPKYDTPAYTVKNTHTAVEIRDYEPMLIAQVTTIGERNDAIRQGFSILFGYISGKNDTKTKLPMTTPVGQYAFSEDANNDRWVTAFILPKGYTKETLPTPTNTTIEFLALPATTWAVFQFSGNPNTQTLQQHSQALKKTLQEVGMPTMMPSTPVCYAFYNPPFTLPFLRRNEVMVRINPS